MTPGPSATAPWQSLPRVRWPARWGWIDDIEVEEKITVELPAPPTGLGYRPKGGISPVTNGALLSAVLT